MPQKFIQYQGKKYYLGYTFNSLAKAKDFVHAQRRYGVVCTIKKSPPFYYVYCPYRAGDVIYTKGRAGKSRPHPTRSSRTRNVFNLRIR